MLNISKHFSLIWMFLFLKANQHVWLWEMIETEPLPIPYFALVIIMNFFLLYLLSVKVDICAWKCCRQNKNVSKLSLKVFFIRCINQTNVLNSSLNKRSTCKLVTYIWNDLNNAKYSKTFLAWFDCFCSWKPINMSECEKWKRLSLCRYHTLLLLFSWLSFFSIFCQLKCTYLHKKFPYI